MNFFINFISFVFIFILLLIPIIIATDVFEDFSSSGSVITLVICFIMLIGSGYYIFFMDFSSNKTLQTYITTPTSSSSGIPMTPSIVQALPQQVVQAPPQIPQQQVVQAPPSQIPQQQVVQAPQPQQVVQTPQQQQVVQSEPHAAKYYSKVRELNNNVKKMLSAMHK